MNSNPVAGIIFDLEGTLIASEDVLGAGLNQAMPRQHCPAQWAPTELRDPITAIMRFRGSRHKLLSSMENSDITPILGLSEVLERLRKDYLLAVVSNARKDVLEILLRRGGIAHHFEVVVSIDDVSLGKPDPEGVHVACARLGLKSQETVVVGDTEQDATAARRSGSNFVLARWGGQTINGVEYTTTKNPAELESLLSSWNDYENTAALSMSLPPTR